MTNPDFVLLAKAMGVHAIRCNNVDELPAKMKEFLEWDESKPVLMECMVEINEHVYPMVRRRTLIHPVVYLYVGRYQPERPCMNRFFTLL